MREAKNRPFSSVSTENQTGPNPKLSLRAGTKTTKINWILHLKSSELQIIKSPAFSYLNKTTCKNSDLNEFKFIQDDNNYNNISALTLNHV